jgi:mannose-6-phosphate isomerase-like protein (cupin superfamily)
MRPLNLSAALGTFDEPWAPRTVATVNDYDVRVFRARDEFARHTHPDTDELFLVLEGRLTIRMDDGDVELGPGDLYVVPRGVAHQPYSAEGAAGLLLEPSSTVNTGDTPGELTAERRVLDQREA